MASLERNRKRKHFTQPKLVSRFSLPCVLLPSKQGKLPKTFYKTYCTDTSRSCCLLVVDAVGRNLNGGRLTTKLPAIFSARTASAGAQARTLLLKLRKSISTTAARLSSLTRYRHSANLSVGQQMKFLRCDKYPEMAN